MADRFAWPPRQHMDAGTARSERVLGGVGQGGGAVVGDVLHAEVLEHLEQRAPDVAEGDRAVVRIALFEQHVAIEAAHFGDGEYADAAEGVRAHVEHLALGHIGAQRALAVALQAVEGHVARGQVALERAAGKVRFAAGGLEQAVLDQLIANRAAVAQLAGVIDAEKINGRELCLTYSTTSFFAAIYPPRLANDFENVPI